MDSGQLASSQRIGLIIEWAASQKKRRSSSPAVPLDAAPKFYRIEHGLADQLEDFALKVMSADPRPAQVADGAHIEAV